MRRGGDERHVFGADDGVERARGLRIDQHVRPPERASRADRLVDRHVAGIARRSGAGGRPAHDARVPRDEGLHAPPRPKRCVGQELGAVRRIESQRGFEQADASFGLQIIPRDPGAQEVLGEPRDVVQTRLDCRPGIVDAHGFVATRLDRFAHHASPSDGDRPPRTGTYLQRVEVERRGDRRIVRRPTRTLAAASKAGVRWRRNGVCRRGA